MVLRQRLGSVGVVAEFLSDEWIAAMSAAARAAVVDPDLRLVIQQVVDGGPGGIEVAYVLDVGDGRLSVRQGRAERPDVTFHQDRATAQAIQRGEVSAQAAFMDGRLRVTGDLRAVIDGAGALAAIDDVFAAARA